MKEVSVLIVSYETADVLAACLDSLLAETAGLEAEVLVVDNGSSDGSATLVGERYPWVRLIALQENLGFARACNLAAREAEGEHLLLLNPDTVVHKRAVQGLLAFARTHPQHGVYGGRSLNADGSLLRSSCWGFPSLWSLACFATGLSTVFPRSRLFAPESLGAWPRDTVREVDIVTGCLLLIRRSVWEELGGFDPRFFMYGEDADLCRRAWNNGWRPVIVPDAVVTHHRGASFVTSGKRMTLILKGKVAFFDAHWSRTARATGRGLYWVGTGLRALLGSETWRTVWRNRHDWLAGYPEAAESSASSSARA